MPNVYSKTFMAPNYSTEKSFLFKTLSFPHIQASLRRTAGVVSVVIIATASNSLATITPQTNETYVNPKNPFVYDRKKIMNNPVDFDDTTEYARYNPENNYYMASFTGNSLEAKVVKGNQSSFDVWNESIVFHEEFIKAKPKRQFALTDVIVVQKKVTPSYCLDSNNIVYDDLEFEPMANRIFEL